MKASGAVPPKRAARLGRAKRAEHHQRQDPEFTIKTMVVQAKL
jgi:hypothetical protein